MFGFFQQKNALKLTAKNYYEWTMRHSRAPALYQECEVPDDVDGHFDSFCVHLGFILIRLQKTDQALLGKKVSQALFDYSFRQMDIMLREMGIGDLGVPKHMKRMMKAFNGRIHRFDAILSMDDPEMMREALRVYVALNLYNITPEKLDESQRDFSKILDYLEAYWAFLNMQSDDAVLSGEICSLIPKETLYAYLMENKHQTVKKGAAS